MHKSRYLPVFMIVAMLPVAGMLLFSQVDDSPGAERPLLELSAVLDAVLEENPELDRLRLLEMQSRSGYAAARAGIGPQVDLELEPYAIDQRRIEVPGEPEEIAPGGPEVSGPPEGRTSRTHSAGGTLRFSQALPSGGRLSAETGLQGRISRLLDENGSDTDPTYELEPSAGVQFSQPLFVNGRLVDVRIGRSLDREASVGLRNAGLSRLDAENGTALAAIELYFVAGNLRDAVETLEISRSIERLRIEELEGDVQIGAAGEQQLLRARLAENRIREALLDTREQLRAIERSLTRLSGERFDLREFSLERSGDYAGSGQLLAGEIATLREEFPPEAEEAWNIENNSAVRRTQIALGEAEDSAITSDVDRAAEFTLAGRLSRRYPDERPEESDAASAFTDLFASDAGFDWSIRLGLNIPIFDGGQRTYARARDQIAIRIAEVERLEARAEARDELSGALERLAIIADRVEILDSDRSFEENRLEEILSLAEIESASDIDVREVALSLSESENALAQTKLDLFLTLLEVEQILGRSVTGRLETFERE